MTQKLLFAFSFMAIIVFASAIGFTMDQANQDEPDEQIIKVNLTTPILARESAEGQSMFVELTPKAVQIGLKEIQLLGSLKQTILPDKSTRMAIEWHSISLPVGQSSLTRNLTVPLTSQFRTKDQRVEPGTVLTAVGNLDSLIEDFLKLKEEADKDRTAKHIVEKEEDEEEETKSDFSPGGSSGGSSAGGDSFGSLDSPGDFSTDLQTSSWEECEPRISQGDNKIYRQSRQVYTNEAGTVTESGQCIDYGGSVEIVKEYGEPCNVIYDYDNKKAYEQYQEYGVIDGKTIMVTNCSNDFTRAYDIYSRADNCGVRHDFVAGQSIIQEKLYYSDNAGQETQISDCLDSNKAYSHFLTNLTCSPYVDHENGLVFEYKRTAYRLDDGTIEYASDCRAMEGDGYQLFESYCEQKYEHDFTAGQSYYRTRDYYINDAGETVYLSDCTRSTKISFPHIHNTVNCGVTHDDANLVSIQESTTVIDTPEDGTIEISPCQATGAAVPYTYIGIENQSVLFTSSGTWTVPDTIKNVTFTLVAGGGRGGIGKGGAWTSSVYASPGKPGYGKNGGNGGAITTSGWRISGAGGGGAGGEIITDDLTVTEGQTFVFTIGNQSQNSTFNGLTARYGYGANGANASFQYGGKGGAGFDSVALAGKGIRYPWPLYESAAGKGGIGYGAGGGGGAGGGINNGVEADAAGGAGAKGCLLIQWTVNKYRRVDGTFFIGQP